MIKNTIQQNIQNAMKSGDAIRVSTLRLLSNAIHNEEIAKQSDLTEEEELALVRRQLKQREEAVEALRQAQGKHTSATPKDLENRVEKEKQEAEILKEFQPQQMPESDLSELVDKVISELDTNDFGSVMKAVMAEVNGKADGKTISRIVAEKLK